MTVHGVSDHRTGGCASAQQASVDLRVCARYELSHCASIVAGMPRRRHRARGPAPRRPGVGHPRAARQPPARSTCRRPRRRVRRLARDDPPRPAGARGPAAARRAPTAARSPSTSPTSCRCRYRVRPAPRAEARDRPDGRQPAAERPAHARPDRRHHHARGGPRCSPTASRPDRGHQRAEHRRRAGAAPAAQAHRDRRRDPRRSPTSWSARSPTRRCAGLNIGVAVVGVDGISADGGLTTHDEIEAHTNATLIRARRRVIVVADGSKVGRVLLARIAGSTRSTSSSPTPWPTRSRSSGCAPPAPR